MTGLAASNGNGGECGLIGDGTSWVMDEAQKNGQVSHFHFVCLYEVGAQAKGTLCRDKSLIGVVKCDQGNAHL